MFFGKLFGKRKGVTFSDDSDNSPLGYNILITGRGDSHEMDLLSTFCGTSQKNVNKNIIKFGRKEFKPSVMLNI